MLASDQLHPIGQENLIADGYFLGRCTYQHAGTDEDVRAYGDVVQTRKFDAATYPQSWPSASQARPAITADERVLS